MRIWIVFLFCFNVAISQPTRVKGTVGDAKTKKPLSYATIRLANTSLGTISNADGEFLLNISSFPAAIIVSYVGYETDTLSVPDSSSADHKLKVSLKPAEIVMPAVEVVSQDSTAINLVHRTYESLKKLHDKKIEADGFLRIDETVNDTLTAEIMEMFVKVLMNNQRVIDRSIEQGRYAEAKYNDKFKFNLTNMSYFNTYYFGLYSSYEKSFFSFLPFVKKPSYLFPVMPHAERYFDLRTEGTYERNGRKIVVIHFSPREHVGIPCFGGEMQIDPGKNQVVSISETLNDPRFKPFDFNFGGFYPDSFQLAFNARCQVGPDGNYWLHFLDAKFSLSVKKEHDPSFSRRFDYKSFIVYYKYGSPEGFKSEVDETKDAENIKKAGYDPNFWKRHEDVINEIPIEENIKESFIKHGFYGNLFPGGEPLNEK